MLADAGALPPDVDERIINNPVCLHPRRLVVRLNRRLEHRQPAYQVGRGGVRVGVERLGLTWTEPT
jgi:hypothetical protein